MQNALILAGGKSSRMGFDKSLLKYDNFATITHFLYYKLSKLFACVQVSAKEQKFTPPLPLLKDDFKDFAPIFVLPTILAPCFMVQFCSITAFLPTKA